MATGYLDSFGSDLNTRFAVGSGGVLTGYKDLSGNDLNTRFAPYVSGAIGSLTGYKDLAGNDLNGRFAPVVPPPNFPTLQSSVPNIGNVVYVDMDGVNCVVSTQGGSPAGDTYTYLYWSDNSGETLNRATIGGVSNQKFWGCVAISGPNAIAMGRLTSTGTNTFFLSTDYGKTYTATSSTGQITGTTNEKVFINISGTNAVWGSFDVERPVYYSTNYGASWTASNLTTYVHSIGMYGNNVYICAAGMGFWYSTNGGQSFTKNANVTGNISAVTQVGTNIYIGTQNKIYKLLSSNLAAAPNTPYTFIADVFAMSSCNTSTGGDFIIIGTTTLATHFYSNNGGPLQTFTRNNNIYKMVANNSRIIMGHFASGLYWGKNNFIT